MNVNSSASSRLHQKIFGTFKPTRFSLLLKLVLKLFLKSKKKEDVDVGQQEQSEASAARGLPQQETLWFTAAGESRPLLTSHPVVFYTDT